MLPWNERVTSFQINPESATIADIVRMAEELVLIRGGGGKPSLAVELALRELTPWEAVRELPPKPPRP